MKNAIPATAGSIDDESDVAGRIARRTMAARGPDYAAEVRRLLDAGLQVMTACGTTSRPRVADIVAAAGLSNDAFYRHFASKDALVAALLEDGTERLASYLAHQMDKARSPAAELRRWVEGILSQAGDEDVAASTLAVLWNAGSIGDGLDSGRPSAVAPLAALVREPLARLGSTDPDLDAALVSHTVVGRLSDHLWQRAQPTRREIDHLVSFCLAAVGASEEAR